MLKKTITYKDLDGNEVSDDFYFHITKAELTELFLVNGEGFVEYLQNVVKAGDGGTIIKEFKKILAMSYGKRSEDNKRFIKSPELWEEFTQTEAYSDFFMQLVTDANFASEFIRGVMPNDLKEGIPTAVPEAKDVPGRPVENVELPENENNDDLPAWFKENRQPTRRELMLMSQEELTFAMRMRGSLPR